MRAGEMGRIWHEVRAKKPRQEICAPLKWFCFMLNFIVFLVGVTSLALGIYLCTKDPRPISEWEDIVLNPAVIITIIGFIVCIVSLCGLFGALRDNVFLLKTFALCVFCGYVLLVIATFALFMLFYADGNNGFTIETGITAHSILLYSLKKYHTNRNIADFVDYVHEQFECCGASSSAQGYRDWQSNEQFQCNQSNPYPERCGVPFSCCRKSVIGAAATEAIVEDGSSINANSLQPAMRSLQCWQNAQTKRESDLDADIYTRGCLQPLRTLFERYAMHLGAIVAAIILPVCIGVCLTQCLARQIDYQRYLLEREARRNERRKRRELRYTEEEYTQNRRQSIDAIKNNDPNLMENGCIRQINNIIKTSNGVQLKMSTPPKFPPPPTPHDELNAAELAATLEASRRQWYKDEERRRRQRRTISTSPLRHNNRVESRLTSKKKETQILEYYDILKEHRRQQENKTSCELSSRKRTSEQLNVITPSNTNNPAIPPLPSYASQQYLLKQSDFS